VFFHIYRPSEGGDGGVVSNKLVLAVSPTAGIVAHFSLMTVIDNIIKLNYLLSDGKSTTKSVYYLHSRVTNDR